MAILIEVKQITYSSSINIPERTKAVETKISVRPKLVPKKYKNGIVVFPQENNKRKLNGIRIFTSNVYYVRGFLRKRFIMYETFHIRGKVKERCKENIEMSVSRRPYWDSD